MPTRRTLLRLAGVVGLLTLGGIGAVWFNTSKPPRAILRTEGHWNFGGGFAEGGRSYFTHGPGGTVVWDTATWRRRSKWDLLACPIVAINRDGLLGVGIHGHDDTSAPIVVVDLATGEVRHRLDAGRPAVTLAAFSPDSQTVIACLADWQGFNREVVRWDLATGATTRVLVGGPGPGMTGPQPLAIAPDATTLALGDYRGKSLELWDARTGQTIGQPWAVANPSPHGSGSVAFTADGQSLLVGQDDGRIAVWDTRSARLVRTIMAHPSGKMVRQIRVAPDGRTILAAGVTLHDGSPLGQWIINVTRVFGVNHFNEAEVVALDLSTGQTLARWPGPHLADLAPDGRTVVTYEMDGSYAVRDVPLLPPEPSRPPTPRGKP